MSPRCQTIVHPVSGSGRAKQENTQTRCLPSRVSMTRPCILPICHHQLTLQKYFRRLKKVWIAWKTHYDNIFQTNEFKIVENIVTIDVIRLNFNIVNFDWMSKMRLLCCKLSTDLSSLHQYRMLAFLPVSGPLWPCPRFPAWGPTSIMHVKYLPLSIQTSEIINLERVLTQFWFGWHHQSHHRARL